MTFRKRKYDGQLESFDIDELMGMRQHWEPDWSKVVDYATLQSQCETMGDVKLWNDIPSLRIVCDYFAVPYTSAEEMCEKKAVKKALWRLNLLISEHKRERFPRTDHFKKFVGRDNRNDDGFFKEYYIIVLELIKVFPGLGLHPKTNAIIDIEQRALIAHKFLQVAYNHAKGIAKANPALKAEGEQKEKNIKRFKTIDDEETGSNEPSDDSSRSDSKLGQASSESDEPIARKTPLLRISAPQTASKTPSHAIPPLSLVLRSTKSTSTVSHPSIVPSGKVFSSRLVKEFELDKPESDSSIDMALYARRGQIWTSPAKKKPSNGSNFMAALRGMSKQVTPTAEECNENTHQATGIPLKLHQLQGVHKENVRPNQTVYNPVHTKRSALGTIEQDLLSFGVRNTGYLAQQVLTPNHKDGDFLVITMEPELQAMNTLLSLEAANKDENIRWQTNLSVDLASQPENAAQKIGTFKQMMQVTSTSLRITDHEVIEVDNSSSPSQPKSIMTRCLKQVNKNCSDDSKQNLLEKPDSHFPRKARSFPAIGSTMESIPSSKHPVVTFQIHWVNIDDFDSIRTSDTDYNLLVKTTAWSIGDPRVDLTYENFASYLYTKYKLTETSLILIEPFDFVVLGESSSIVSKGECNKETWYKLVEKDQRVVIEFSTYRARKAKKVRSGKKHC